MICSRHSLERCGRINYPQVIRQEPEQLREREQQLRGTVLVARVRLLRLLKTGQAHNLRHAAELLGYSTVQVTRWWERYRQVGLSGLLTGKARPGRPSRMTTAAWRGLQQQMKAGRISRLEEARQYLRAHWKINYASVNGVWRLFQQRRVKFKTGRRRHRQGGAGGARGVQKNFRGLLRKHAVQRVLAIDEGRFGLKAWFRRRWCPCGVRPPWIVEDRYEWIWVYVAVEPTTGWSYVLLLPETDSRCLEIFCRHLRQALGSQRVGVVLDGAGSHRSKQWAWPQDLVPLFLPAHSP